MRTPMWSFVRTPGLFRAALSSRGDDLERSRLVQLNEELLLVLLRLVVSVLLLLVPAAGAHLLGALFLRTVAHGYLLMEKTSAMDRPSARTSPYRTLLFSSRELAFL